MRIIGLESEYALGFAPRHRDAEPPSQEALFGALRRALKGRHPSCEALYYKGGDFFANGSLVHFEVASLERPETGLLEWATPECLGPVEAATYAKAQERALREAIPDAEGELTGMGHPGRLYLLKNNQDRFGNPYGCHESYDIGERPLGLLGWLASYVAHPLALVSILVIGLLMAVPILGLLLGLLLLLLLAQLLGLLPGLRGVARGLRDRLHGLAEFLVEVSPTPGSGVVAHTSLWFLRIGGVIFSLTARRVLFRGHLPALLPFLVTRPVLAGAGHLTTAGSLQLTPRSDAIQRSVAAFIFGPSRPLVDVKEYFYRRPLSFRQPRKRLHLLAGDANRSEYVELLKLATTSAVLDAIEAGAFDEMARRLELREGPVGAFRRTSRDPTLKAIVARDRETNEQLTALAVQRRYLYATWEHFRSQPSVPPEVKDALVRWNFVLDGLAESPLTLDGELDWVIKLKLMNATLEDARPDLTLEEAWGELRAWGPVNAQIELRCPGLELDADLPGPAVELRLRAALGRAAFRRAARAVASEELAWEELPAVRAAWLRLKTIDLKYHEISSEGGYYDWWADSHRVSRVLEPERIEAAMRAPPPRTRAGIRGRYVDEYAKQARGVRVGWDRIVVEQAQGSQRTIHIRDPYQHELEESEQ